MILEVAILNIKTEMSNDFECAFQRASSIISSMPGYVSHDLQKCLEKSDRYLLLVYWQSLEDHLFFGVETHGIAVGRKRRSDLLILHLN